MGASVPSKSTAMTARAGSASTAANPRSPSAVVGSVSTPSILSGGDNRHISALWPICGDGSGGPLPGGDQRQPGRREAREGGPDPAGGRHGGGQAVGAPQ